MCQEIPHGITLQKPSMNPAEIPQEIQNSWIYPQFSGISSRKSSYNAWESLSEIFRRTPKMISQGIIQIITKNIPPQMLQDSIQKLEKKISGIPRVINREFWDFLFSENSVIYFRNY